MIIEKLFEAYLRKAKKEDAEKVERNIEIFVAHYAYDMPYARIAEEFEITAIRVRAIIEHVHRILRGRIANLNLA